MYTLVILVRNIVAGFDAVPADVLEAADGMGYDRRERLRRIELPLAIPLIIAGLRLASVSTIGLVTITATLGDAFGGLGFFIFEGYNREFPTEILVGAVPSILLAIAIDVPFVRVQRRLTPWAHRPAHRRADRRRSPLIGPTECCPMIAWLTRPGQLVGPERHPDPAGRAHRDLGRCRS